jgi:hypothetical protein
VGTANAIIPATVVDSHVVRGGVVAMITLPVATLVELVVSNDLLRLAISIAEILWRKRQRRDV